MQQFRIEDYHDASTPQLDPNQNVPEIRELIDKYKKIQSRSGHTQLKNDLIEHVWARFGSE
jgi:hypothetical protein